jgi:hypothetical protein
MRALTMGQQLKVKGFVMKRTLSIMFAALALSAPAVNRAHATDWWNPNYQTKQCMAAAVPPIKAAGVLLTNGYPDATLAEVGSGIVLIWLTANHTNNLLFFQNRAGCDKWASGVGASVEKFK